MEQYGAILTCRELVELMTDYVEERLNPHDHAWVENHLAACAECRAYLAQMRQTIQLLGTLTEETITPSARDRLLRLFQGWKRGAVS